MISADEARKLAETNAEVRLRSYVERVYGQIINEVAERHMTHITTHERRPREAIKEIVNYLEEYGYRVVTKEVANPLWSIEIYW